ncbi:protein kinase [bacterium]|nr:protein kinase [bacterium]
MSGDEFYIPGNLIEGRYLIEDIRRGSMGIVYLCVDKAHNRPVAIKTFEERYLNIEGNRRMFLDEAAMWIQLDSHPNIVRAYSVKMFDNKPHLLMERVIGSMRGSTLKDFFFSSHVSEKQMIQIGIHICNGMIHAIKKFPNWVHRDLKTENVLFGQDELPKISDFGMTLHVDPHPMEDFTDYQNNREKFNPKVLAKRMMGTPAFSSPEQCLCKPLDTRADVYSVGCILYHIASKRMPFHRSTVEDTIYAQVKEKPVPPHEHNPYVSKDFSNIILTCLNKNPIDRYLSFYALYEDLRNLYYDYYGEEPIGFTEGTEISSDEHIDRAWSFVLLGRFSIAAKELESARRAQPSRQDISFHFGKLRYLQNKYDEALVHLEEAIKAMPENSEILELLGKCYVEKGQLDSGLKIFRELRRIQPQSQTGYLELAKIYRKQNDNQSTQQVLQEGLKQCKETRHLLLLMANCLHDQREYQKEKEILTQYCQEFTDDVNSMLHLAELSLLLGMRVEALEWAKRVHETPIRSFQSFYRLGNLFRTLGDFSNAEGAWEMARELEEGHPLFYKDYAALCYQLRDYEKSWDLLLKAEELGADVEELKRKVQANRFRLL